MFCSTAIQISFLRRSPRPDQFSNAIDLDFDKKSCAIMKFIEVVD